MELIFLEAVVEDLPEIVRMLADDFLGAQREHLKDPLPESYMRAFREIDADPNNELVVPSCQNHLRWPVTWLRLSATTLLKDRTQAGNLCFRL